MGLYERIWKDEKNRTILLSIIIIIASLILVMVFASWDCRINNLNWCSCIDFLFLLINSISYF